jgi:hypothetical protein
LAGQAFVEGSVVTIFKTVGGQIILLRGACSIPIPYLFKIFTREDENHQSYQRSPDVTVMLIIDRRKDRSGIFGIIFCLRKSPRYKGVHAGVASQLLADS